MSCPARSAAPARLPTTRRYYISDSDEFPGDRFIVRFDQALAWTGYYNSAQRLFIEVEDGRGRIVAGLSPD